MALIRQLKYIVIWIATVILFNLICFFAPIGAGNIGNHSGGFWAGYGFAMAAFVLHLVFSCIALSEKNKEKKVLNNPLIIISSVELCLMILAGIVCMVVTAIPYWLGIIICYALLLLSVIFFITAKAVGENAHAANRTLNAKTSVFRELTDMAQELVSVSSTSEEKDVAKKIYDSIRYSDMVSCEETEDEELIIRSKIEHLIESVRNRSEFDAVSQASDEILLLVEKRNNKCKASKRKM